MLRHRTVTLDLIFPDPESELSRARVTQSSQWAHWWRFKQQQQDQWQSVVALHDGGVSPGPGFKERVKLVRTENPRNCSITLGPVVFTDGGVYQCKALHTDHIFSDVTLSFGPLSGVGSVGLGVLVLNGVVGKSVAFPDAVKKSGTLRHKGDEQQTIGDVTRGQFTGFREGRVHWNSATGLFSISGLKVEDSGVYTLLNNDAERRKRSQYQLNVDRLGVLVLNGVVGQSVAFPDAVKKSGSLTHTNHLTIGDVTGGQFTDFRERRVHWNSATGLFSISGLKMEDSGMYALWNNDERSKENQYQLNVDDSSLSGGAVAGIVVGLLAFVAAIIAMIIAVWKNQRMPGWRAIFSGDTKANEKNDDNSRGQNTMFPNDPSVPAPRPVPETEPFLPETKSDVPDAQTSVRSW
ncbi:hypothetical protein AAFF_G00271960 [Aldrovandia affinis]|uniref:Ig-like domain-containing protein n=1 Tax=Aldrovandia affinis TaxID=143900 RepID=A0AAD7W2B9_9TELE|nr:hypothetical protein AAFF_G00271960 [Aldrovandia affinis]